MSASKASITRGYTSSIKGKVFELVLRELLKKAGFDFDFDTDQLTYNRKRLHGRGGTYDPDILGTFKLGIPFINPLLLVGEAKYYNGMVKISEAREFLGCFIDISQFPKIDTKGSSKRRYSILFTKRYNYCPIFFSLTGFQQSAEALMFAHGINFISYKNSGVIIKLYDLAKKVLDNISFGEFQKEDYKNFETLETLSDMRAQLKKDYYDDSLIALLNYLRKVNSSIGILDGQFPIHLLYEKKVTASIRRDIKIKFKKDNVYEMSNTGNRKFGEFTLPEATFLREYAKTAKEIGKEEDIFRHIDLVTEIDGTLAIKQLLISESSRESLLQLLNLNELSEEEE